MVKNDGKVTENTTSKYNIIEQIVKKRYTKQLYFKFNSILSLYLGR